MIARRNLLLGTLALTAMGCFGKAPAPPPPPPIHDLCLESSPRLNWYENEAHTVFVRIFQLSSVDAFAQANAERLLDSKEPLPGVEGAVIDRTLYPGAKINVNFTQQPAAAYVGVVAAFYKLAGSGKTYVFMSSLDGGPCIRLGGNAIETPPAGPQPKPAPAE